MKNLIKIFVFFALTILFASSAYAESMDEYFQRMDLDSAATQSCIAGLPKPASPSAWCQYYRSMNVCYLGRLIQRATGEQIIESASGDDCTIIVDVEGGGAQHHFYYSGNEFCSETGIGTPRRSKTCVPRTDIRQPTSIPKSENSKTQLEIEQNNAVRLMNEYDAKLKKETKRIDDMMRQRNEKDAANSQINQLQTFNDALKDLMKDLETSVTKLKNWAGSIFDGAKSLFKK
jgi:hypothetical protein